MKLAKEDEHQANLYIVFASSYWHSAVTATALDFGNGFVGNGRGDSAVEISSFKYLRTFPNT